MAYYRSANNPSATTQDLMTITGNSFVQCIIQLAALGQSGQTRQQAGSMVGSLLVLFFQEQD